MLTPAEIVDLLRPTTPDLAPRIGCMNKTWTADGAKISGQFFYVTFRDGKPTIDDLITVAHARMVNFVMPRSRIEETLAEMAATPGVMDPWVLLQTEARDLFMRTDKETGRSGELGELLLYMLIEWVLKAPIVACKMYLKTAQQMPVHGVDGIHLGYDSDKLIMHWGESKLHKTLPSALDDIAKSISEYVKDPTKYASEVRIISRVLKNTPASSSICVEPHFFEDSARLLWLRARGAPEPLCLMAHAAARSFGSLTRL